MEKETILQDERYLKIIEINGKFVFKIYPRNNKNQELGTSTEYGSFAECKTASSDFIRFILKNSVNTEKSPFVALDKKQANGTWFYRYVLTDADKKALFYQRTVSNSVSAKKGVSSLYNTVIESICGRK